MACTASRLAPARFAFSFALVYGVGFILWGWAAALWGWGAVFVQTIGSAYIGFSATFWGAVLGGVWAFVVMFVFLIISAWIYNACLGKKASS